MVMNISSALSAYKQASQAPATNSAFANTATKSGESFSDMVTGFLTDTVDTVRQSETMVAQGAVGKADLQDVILAVSDAEVMIQTVTAIRDKMVSAYQEIIRSAI